MIIGSSSKFKEKNETKGIKKKREQHEVRPTM
jgi:hypothetical protein